MTGIHPRCTIPVRTLTTPGRYDGLAHVADWRATYAMGVAGVTALEIASLEQVCLRYMYIFSKAMMGHPPVYF